MCSELIPLVTGVDERTSAIPDFSISFVSSYAGCSTAADVRRQLSEKFRRLGHLCSESSDSNPRRDRLVPFSHLNQFAGSLLAESKIRHQRNSGGQSRSSTSVQYLIGSDLAPLETRDSPETRPGCITGKVKPVDANILRDGPLVGVFQRLSISPRLHPWACL